MRIDLNLFFVEAEQQIFTYHESTPIKLSMVKMGRRKKEG
jgi:hypothetical protein